MCFPLTYLFNTRSGRDTKLFTLQPNMKTELKWFVNAGAESGLGVSVAGVDKHDTTHTISGSVVCWGSTRNGGSVPQGRVSLCSEHERTKCAVQPPKKDLKDARARYQEVRRDTKRRAMCRRVAQGIKMTPTHQRRFGRTDAVHGCESCSGLPIVIVTTSKALDPL